MALQDRSEFGLMKLIVDKPEAAHLALSEKGLPARLRKFWQYCWWISRQLSEVDGCFFQHGVNILMLRVCDRIEQKRGVLRRGQRAPENEGGVGKRRI